MRNIYSDILGHGLWFAKKQTSNLATSLVYVSLTEENNIRNLAPATDLPELGVAPHLHRAN